MRALALRFRLDSRDRGNVETVIFVGALEGLEEMFEEVSLVADVRLENVNPWESRFRIALARHPKLDLRAVWPRAKRF